MELSNKNSVLRLLESGGFTFKKSLGQNFLTDPTVCPAMAEACCDDETGVIEIGPGAGVLTVELAKRSKKVIAIELDERLKPILQKTLAQYDNATVIFSDVMKIDLLELIKKEFAEVKRVCICANLPYYITSPIVMMLLESRLPIDSITVMVQKEAAERLCAEVGSRAAGAVTVAVRYYAESEILFSVPRESFYPSPKVDSAVIKLNVLPKPSVTVSNEVFFFKLVKACFAQRRKTLCNTVSNSMSIAKPKIADALLKMGLLETVRAEQLTIEQLAQLSEELQNG